VRTLLTSVVATTQTVSNGQEAIAIALTTTVGEALTLLAGAVVEVGWNGRPARARHRREGAGVLLTWPQATLHYALGRASAAV